MGQFINIPHQTSNGVVTDLFKTEQTRYNMKTKQYRVNYLLYCFGLALTLVVLQSSIGSVETTITSLRNSIDNQNFCQLQLYQIQSFRGNPDRIIRNKRNRRIRRGRDKSARTIGHCCWKLYQKPRYRGRSLILGGNTNLRTTQRRGFFKRVRSVRRISGCTD